MHGQDIDMNDAAPTIAEIAAMREELEWYACLGTPKTRSDPLAQFDDGGKRARIALGREKS